MHDHDHPTRTPIHHNDAIVAALPYPTPPTRPTVSIPPPVPALPHHRRACTAVYALAHIDASGRIADHTTPDALHWHPGQALLATVHRGLVISLRPDHSGQTRISPKRHVALSASLRHHCGIHAGDPLFLIALPDNNLLLIHTLALLDVLLTNHRTDPS